MGKNIRGKFPNYVVHPGICLKESIDIRNINQEELAIRTGFSPKHISEVLSCKKGISPLFAKRLEYVFDGVSAQFWMNMQMIYEKNLTLLEEEKSISKEEKEKSKLFEDVYQYSKNNDLVYDGDDLNKIIYLRRLLNISDLTNIDNLYFKKSLYKLDKNIEIDKSRLYAWQTLCEKISKKDEIEQKFDFNLFLDNLRNIRNCMFLRPNNVYNELKNIFKKCGIKFYVIKQFDNIPIEGYVFKKDENVSLFISLKNNRAYNFWFILFHEISHILNNDFNDYMFDYYDVDTKYEKKADFFAKTFMIDEDDFTDFIKQNKFDITSVKKFADKVNVPEFIVIGRLQDHLNDNDLLSKYNVKYSWIDKI